MRVAEAGLVNAVGDAAFAALVGLVAQQSMHELQMRQALLFRAAQERVKLLGPQRHLQRRAVGQHPFT